ETSVLSATGTVALTVEAAGDLLTATTQAGLTAGSKDLNVDSNGSTAIKTSQARSVVMTVATAALTAGKFRVVVFYKCGSTAPLMAGMWQRVTRMRRFSPT